MAAVGVRHLTMLLETPVRVSEWMNLGFVVVVLLLTAPGLTMEVEQRCAIGVVLVVLLLFVQDSRLDCSLLLHELLLVVPVLLLCFRCLFPSLRIQNHRIGTAVVSFSRWSLFYLAMLSYLLARGLCLLPMSRKSGVGAFVLCLTLTYAVEYYLIF